MQGDGFKRARRTCIDDTVRFVRLWVTWRQPPRAAAGGRTAENPHVK